MSDEIISKALGLPTIASYDKKEENVEIVENMPVLDGELVEDDLPTVVESITPQEIEEQEVDTEFFDDVDKAKFNISKMILDGHQAFETLILLAVQTENPRAFEVASKMMTDLVNANKEMVNVSEKKREVKYSKTSGISNNTTNNNLFLTTTNLLKMLKNNEEEK